MIANRRFLFRCVFFGIVTMAAFAPLMDRGLRTRSELGAASSTLQPQWPGEIEGRALSPLPLSQRDVRFAQDFPGQIREFTDGRRDYILRCVNAPTRMLHSTADCLRGSGFAVKLQPIWRDSSGVQWTCLTATRGLKRLRVRERISDQAGNGWTDFSAWYWNAILKKSAAPWLAVTILETE